MEKSPFYGSYWSQPARPRNSSKISPQLIHHNPTVIKPASKIVQIPVHFVGSEPERSIQKQEPDRSGSAIKIQKVYRGFLVRKSVKRIMSIRKEVDEIERKLSCRKTVELIHSDEKERLRVNETLMSLLLKLDSIRVFDSGVRDCRKAVIKKAISLQEKVDSIVSVGDQIAAVEEVDQYNVTGNIDDSTGNQDENGKCMDQSEVPDLSGQCVEAENKNPCNESDSTGNQDESGKSMDQTEVSELLEQCVAEDCPMKDEKMQLENEHDEDGDLNEGNEGDERKRTKELLEKMVEENEKMMRMMNELCQKNQIQTQMMNSLAQRVEQLEKSFVCDRLKTKKKKKRHPV